MKRRSLRTQLIAWNTATLAVLFCAISLMVHYGASAALRKSVDRALRQNLMQMPGLGVEPNQIQDPGLEPPDDWRQRPPRDSLPPTGQGGGAPPEPEDSNTRSLLPRHFDAQGTPFGQRKLLSRDSFEAAIRSQSEDTRRVFIEGEPMQILTVPTIRRGRIVSVGQIGYRLREVEDAILGLDRTLLWITPIGVVFAAAGGVLLTHRVLRRIHITSQAVREISARGDIGTERLPVTGNDEFAELATVFNMLLARQEEAFREQQLALEQQRRFTGDASHELKSPLTVIKGTSQMTLEQEAPLSPEQYRRALSRIDEAASVMVNLVQDLLLLARSDGHQLGKQPIEVLASEILERAERLARPPGQAAPPLVIDLDDPALTIWGNEEELIRLFANLLSNAFRYTPPSGTVTVTAQSQGEWRSLSVTDSGTGIAPEHLPHLGERFYRVDLSRTRGRGGSGLGLSICRSIVTAHGGTLEFSSELGYGTTVIVRLPPRFRGH